ncbi:CDKN2AIP N-terminal [Sigmodon hispidus]
MVGGEPTVPVEELVSGVRQAADFAEQFRSYSESEKQWKARMEFILRHLPDYRDPPDGGGRLDQLLSLSMVWANHLFLGCRCGPPPASWHCPRMPTLSLAISCPTLRPA